MLGILCEKPGAARNFAKALGGMTGSFNNQDFAIVNALGHLYEFAQPSDMVVDTKTARYKGRSVLNLPWDPKDFNRQRVQKEKVGDVLRNIR